MLFSYSIDIKRCKVSDFCPYYAGFQPKIVPLAAAPRQCGGRRAAGRGASAGVNESLQRLKFRSPPPLNFRVFENKNPQAANSRGMSVRLLTYWSYMTYKPYKANCAIKSAPKTARNGPKTPHFIGRKGLSGPAIWPVSRRNMAHIAFRYGPYCRTGRFFRQDFGAKAAPDFLFRRKMKC